MGYLQLGGDDRLEVEELLKSVFLTANDVAQFLAVTYPPILGSINTSTRDQAVSDTWQRANAHGALDQVLLGVAMRFPDRPEARRLVLRLSGTAGWSAPVARHGIEPGQLEKLTSRGNPFVDVAAFGRVFVRAERCVCQVRCGDASVGTGFLVGPNLVLTCHHVVSAHLQGSVIADDVEVRFDFRAGIDGAEPKPGAWIGIDAQWSIPSSPHAAADISLQGMPDEDELDYALLRLASPPGTEVPPGHATPRGWVDISQDRSLPAAEAPILIAQHPSAEDGTGQMPLVLTFATPGFKEANDNGTRVAYHPSTRPGSSGAPVFGPKGTAIALHHNRGQIDPNAPDLHLDNRGIPLAKIRAHLADEIRGQLVAPPEIGS